MRKSDVSIALIVALLASPLPVTAQESVRSFDSDGPLARAIAKEGARLALAAQPASSDVEWSRVRRLESGTEITVTIEGTQPAELLFVSADDSGLTVRRPANLASAEAAVLETIARQGIAEISIRKKGRGVWGHLGPFGGYFVGALAAGYGAGLACQAAAGRNRCDTGAFLVGMLAGGIGGGTYGFHAANRETEEIIYKATDAEQQ